MSELSDSIESSASRSSELWIMLGTAQLCSRPSRQRDMPLQRSCTEALWRTASAILFALSAPVTAGHACAAPSLRPHLVSKSAPGRQLHRARMRLLVHGHGRLSELARSTLTPDQPAHRTLPDLCTAVHRRDCGQTDSGHGLQLVQAKCVWYSAEAVVTISSVAGRQAWDGKGIPAP